MNNKFKHGGLIIVAAFGLSACSVNVTDEGISRSDTRKIICDMVDKEALQDADDCKHYKKN
jgi:hypothetical protein